MLRGGNLSPPSPLSSPPAGGTALHESGASALAHRTSPARCAYPRDSHIGSFMNKMASSRCVTRKTFARASAASQRATKA
eukprot:CAMPEP_0118929516 /NCGR_PEP_ID=MMETSP1169-20130426/6498_1 /TAXON_ID=36882 /ORGANISM="Pyramimonas obovata, Strain CCMP722" /LENGTH=79 /DNA_ID=CAMNT_0006871723 /DNA_START=302 /DNA_END=538 /DNA_ORIENTATION=-